MTLFENIVEKLFQLPSNLDSNLHDYESIDLPGWIETNVVGLPIQYVGKDNTIEGKITPSDTGRLAEHIVAAIVGGAMSNGRMATGSEDYLHKWVYHPTIYNDGPFRAELDVFVESPILNISETLGIKYIGEMMLFQVKLTKATVNTPAHFIGKTKEMVESILEREGNGSHIFCGKVIAPLLVLGNEEDDLDALANRAVRDLSIGSNGRIIFEPWDIWKLRKYYYGFKKEKKIIGFPDIFPRDYDTGSFAQDIGEFIRTIVDFIPGNSKLEKNIKNRFEDLAAKADLTHINPYEAFLIGASRKSNREKIHIRDTIVDIYDEIYSLVKIMHENNYNAEIYGWAIRRKKDGKTLREKDIMYRGTEITQEQVKQWKNEEKELRELVPKMYDTFESELAKLGVISCSQYFQSWTVKKVLKNPTEPNEGFHVSYCKRDRQLYQKSVS